MTNETEEKLYQLINEEREFVSLIENLKKKKRNISMQIYTIKQNKNQPIDNPIPQPEITTEPLIVPIIDVIEERFSDFCSFLLGFTIIRTISTKLKVSEWSTYFIKFIAFIVVMYDNVINIRWTYVIQSVVLFFIFTFIIYHIVSPSDTEKLCRMENSWPLDASAIDDSTPFSKMYCKMLNKIDRFIMINICSDSKDYETIFGVNHTLPSISSIITKHLENYDDIGFGKLVRLGTNMLYTKVYNFVNWLDCIFPVELGTAEIVVQWIVLCVFILASIIDSCSMSFVFIYYSSAIALNSIYKLLY